MKIFIMLRLLFYVVIFLLMRDGTSPSLYIRCRGERLVNTTKNFIDFTGRH